MLKGMRKNTRLISWTVVTYYLDCGHRFYALGRF
jgi:hypothetical protein